MDVTIQNKFTSRRGKPVIVLNIVLKSYDETIAQLRELAARDPKFCFMTPDDIPIFTNSSNLELLAKSQEVMIDGTFSYAPPHFTQMYSIHVSVNGFNVPVIYAFLPSTTKEIYVKYQFSVFHVDFEKAAHSAINECFPNSTIYGCTFHLHQSWFRRIQQNKCLLKHYRKKSPVGQWLKKFLALSFLPPEQVYNAFTMLMEEAPLEASNFSYYVLTNYIEDQCSFPPQMWAASPPDSSLRTTNAVESFHNDFNKQFYTPHPNIHLVISVLRGIQAESDLKKTSIKKGASNPMKKSTRDMLEALDELWNQYLEDRNVLSYLDGVSKRYD